MAEIHKTTEESRNSRSEKGPQPQRGPSVCKLSYSGRGTQAVKFFWCNNFISAESTSQVTLTTGALCSKSRMIQDLCDVRRGATYPLA